MNNSVHPKEVYLLEKFSSLDFFEIMRNNYHNFLTGLEELFELYIHNLPYDLRTLPFSEQADINWGETVLPNLRNTMDRIDIAYIKIKSGDFTYLDCAAEIRSNDKGLSEFSFYWMDNLPHNKVKQCWDYYLISKKYALIIEKTYPTYWDKGFLNNKFPKAEIFNGINIKLPGSYPIYRLDSRNIVRSKEKINKTGVYVCNEYDNKLIFLASSKEDDNGFAPRYACRNKETREKLYFETSWTLIERISDQGGTVESIVIENLKALAGQKCPKTGYWWSPANQSNSRYFTEGDIFPKLESDWGETIWYLEATNKDLIG